MARSTERGAGRALPHPVTAALRQLLAAALVSALLAVLVVVGVTMGVRRTFSVDPGNLPSVAVWIGVGIGALVLLAAMVGIYRSAHLHLYLRRHARPPRRKGSPRRPVPRMTERLLEEIDAGDLGTGDARFRMVVVDRGSFAVAFMTPGYRIETTPTIAPLRLGEHGRTALGHVGWLEPERRTIGADGDWQYFGTEYTGPGAHLADNPGIPLDAGKVAVLVTSGDEALAGPVRDLLAQARATR
ncbi:hypothetical protein ACPYO6_05755 [Georgenia sp. Z1344]|uniref:hypothetical protein n=1 Tax=Georgenia sp. Z1344 TaxID=3416706 RepID=UPI003CF899B5